MAGNAPFAKMNGLGNQIIVADMRGRADRVSAAAAVALNADPATRFDQIMAIHDPRTAGTAHYVEILNSDGSRAQACGNGMRCVVQALAAETGTQSFTFETIAGIVNGVELPDGRISVDMGIPRFGWKDIPLAEEFADTTPHRAADRPDRRAHPAFALGRFHRQSARHLLGGERRVGLRSRTLRADARAPPDLPRAGEHLDRLRHRLATR